MFVFEFIWIMSTFCFLNHAFIGLDLTALIQLLNTVSCFIFSPRTPYYFKDLLLYHSWVFNESFSVCENGFEQGYYHWFYVNNLHWFYADNLDILSMSYLDVLNNYLKCLKVIFQCFILHTLTYPNLFLTLWLLLKVSYFLVRVPITLNQCFFIFHRHFTVIFVFKVQPFWVFLINNPVFTHYIYWLWLYSLQFNFDFDYQHYYFYVRWYFFLFYLLLLLMQ